MKRLLLFLQALGLCLGGGAQTILFPSPDTNGAVCRIPAMAQAKNGDIVVLCDYRYNRNDIGWDGGEIDVRFRVSRNGGRKWGRIATAIRHDAADEHRRGYGDVAICADEQGDSLFVMAATGNVNFFESTCEAPIRICRTAGYQGNKGKRWRWRKPADMTEYFYDTLLQGRVKSLFMASGNMVPSRYVKGRIYGVLVCKDAQNGEKHNRVVYTDDHCRTWSLLGGLDAKPIPGGDEAKCVELDERHLLVSSRAAGCRIFNVFLFADDKDAAAQGRGAWDDPAQGIRDNGDSGTNGELLLVNARRASDGKKVRLLLQTIPTDGRSNVSVFYKELSDLGNISSFSFVEGWQKTQLCQGKSAYSTMTLLGDGRIAFFMEEGDDGLGGYNMVFFARTLEEITGNQYGIMPK